MVEGRYPSDDIFRGDFDPEIRKKKSAAAKSIERKAATSKSTSKSQLRRGLALLAGKTEELPKGNLGGTESGHGPEPAGFEAEPNRPMTEVRSEQSGISPAGEPRTAERPRRIFRRAANAIPESVQDFTHDTSEPPWGETSSSFAESLFSKTRASEREEEEEEAAAAAFFEEDEPTYVERSHRFFSHSHPEPASDPGVDAEPSLDDRDWPAPHPWTESVSGGVKRFISRVAHPEPPGESNELPPDPSPPAAAKDEESSIDTDPVWFSQTPDPGVGAEPSLDDRDWPAPHPWTESVSGGVRRFISRVAHPEPPAGGREPRAVEGAGPVDPNPPASDDANFETGGPLDRKRKEGQAMRPAHRAASPALPALLEKAKLFFFQIEEVEIQAPSQPPAARERGPRLGRLDAGLGGLRSSLERFSRPPSLRPPEEVQVGEKRSVTGKSGPKPPLHFQSTAAAPRVPSDERIDGEPRRVQRRPVGRHFASGGLDWEPPQWNLGAEEKAESSPAPPARPSAGAIRERPRHRAAERRSAPTVPERPVVRESRQSSARRTLNRESIGASGATSGGTPSGHRTGRETIALVISVCLILAIILGIGNLRDTGGLVAGKTSAADLAPSTTVVPQPVSTKAPSITATTAPPTTIVVTTTTQPKIAAGANPANAQVTVRVANGTNVAGAAGLITTKLQSLDFNVVVPINATVSNLTTTTVYYYSGFQVAGQAVARLLGLPASAAKPFTSAAPLPNIYPSDVNVVLGSDVAG